MLTVVVLTNPNADVSSITDAFSNTVVWLADEGSIECRLNRLTEQCAVHNPDAVFFASGDAALETAVRLSVRLGCFCFPDVYKIEHDTAGTRLLRKACGSNLEWEYRPDGKQFIAVVAGGRRTEASFANSLESASRVIIGGRGLGGIKNCEKLRLIGQRLDMAVGFTRPAAMNGWCGLREIVGQSGCRVSPDVCLTVGVSGSAAFRAGVDAKYLIAVNTDKNAPIFKFASYGIITDASEFLNALELETKR